MAAQLGPDPTIHRRRFRNEIRRAQEKAGRTAEDVSAAMGWPLLQLRRVEDGSAAVSPVELRALLSLYDMPAGISDSLVKTAQAVADARHAAPWSQWRDAVSPEFATYVAYEASASKICNYETLLVPGLLQTRDYAREAVSVYATPEQVEARLALRMDRQRSVLHNRRTSAHFVLEEEVLYQQVGNDETRRQQLSHLLQVSDQSNVTLSVIPRGQGEYRAARPPYVLLEFEADQDQDILYLEDPLGELIIPENAPQHPGSPSVLSYLDHFKEIEELASENETDRLLHRALKFHP